MTSAVSANPLIRFTLIVSEHHAEGSAAGHPEGKTDQRVRAHGRRHLELADLLIVEKDEHVLDVELRRLADVFPTLEDQAGVRAVIDLRADLHNVVDPERLRQTDPRVAETVAGHVWGRGAPAFRHAGFLGRDEAPVS